MKTILVFENVDSTKKHPVDNEGWTSTAFPVDNFPTGANVTSVYTVIAGYTMEGEVIACEANTFGYLEYTIKLSDGSEFPNFSKNQFEKDARNYYSHICKEPIVFPI